MAIGFFRHGLKVPLVTSPTRVVPSASYISVPWRAGAFMPMIPTRFFGCFFSLPSGVKKVDAPQKPCSVLLRLPGRPRVHASVPMTGFVVSFKSFPYKQRPASNRSESRAPRPVGLTISSSISLEATASQCSAGIAISKPSSPVYPQRVIRHPSMLPSRVTSVPVMNAMDVKSNPSGRIFAIAAEAPGPCRAKSCMVSSRYSIVTSPSKSSRCFWKCSMSPNFVAPFTTIYT
mmetsp:Transcript_97/g.229  ORF Transcript_97/g.229 Transcript_97/m.229 type:complete len:232 (-) Transcript_97:314-1009(-)